MLWILPYLLNMVVFTCWLHQIGHLLYDSYDYQDVELKKKTLLNHWIKFLDVVLEKPRQSYYRSYSISIGWKNKNNDSITGDRNPDPCTRILDHWADSANKTFLTESITLNVAKVKFDISF